jgi:pyroglutamyl-peptidase
MKRVLLTGFEPFGGDAVNASQEIARRLDGAEVAGHAVRGVVLPCVFGRAEHRLFELIRTVKPVLIVCLGQAEGRRAITPELLAVNLDDARIPDNAGNQPVDTPVVSGGPAAWWSGLPVRAMVEAMNARGIPAERSRSAGGFVCNHLFFALMHRLSRRRNPPPAGFIHVPAIGEPDGEKPGLPLEVMVEGIRVALTVCAAGQTTHQPARRRPPGTTRG